MGQVFTDITLKKFNIINIFVFILILITGCNKTNKIQPVDEKKDDPVHISAEIEKQENLNKIMYVNSPEGLRVRNLPSINGDRIGILDYLTEVKIIKEDNDIINIEGIEGRWVNIITPVEGWVFSGFLENEELYKNRLNKIIQDKIVRDSVPDSMVRIDGGTFIMGSPETEPARESSETQHRVTVSSFYMGKYLVTQMEYQEIMGTNPSNFKGDNLPVENVSWYDAIVFCNSLSMAEGLDPAYRINKSTYPAAWGTVPTDWDDPSRVAWDAVEIVAGSTGYRLPTEAQWEYACRAGTTTPFNTGNNITTDQANYNGKNPYNSNPKGIYRNRTTDVESFPPNAWGLYDMHGNVWEWCWDQYGNYDGDIKSRPVHDEVVRVIRGGSWRGIGQYLRSAFRGHGDPSGQNYDIGFRLSRP
jgi:formylglycine-generating enzyme required for sulfatase activity